MKFSNFFLFLGLLQLDVGLNTEKIEEPEDVSVTETANTKRFDIIDSDQEDIKILSTEEQAIASDSSHSHLDRDQTKNLNHLIVNQFEDFRPSDTDIFLENLRDGSSVVDDDVELRITIEEISKKSKSFQFDPDVLGERPHRIQQEQSYLVQPKSFTDFYEQGSTQNTLTFPSSSGKIILFYYLHGKGFILLQATVIPTQ